MRSATVRLGVWPRRVPKAGAFGCPVAGAVSVVKDRLERRSEMVLRVRQQRRERACAYSVLRYQFSSQDAMAPKVPGAGANQRTPASGAEGRIPTLAPATTYNQYKNIN